MFTIAGWLEEAEKRKVDRLISLYRGGKCDHSTLLGAAAEIAVVRELTIELERDMKKAQEKQDG